MQEADMKNILMGQLQQLKAKYDKLQKSMAQYEQCKMQCAEQQAAISQMREANAQLERKLQEADAAAASQLKNAMLDAQKRHHLEMEAAEKKHKIEVDDLEEKHKQALERSQRKMETMRELHKKAEDDLSASHEQEIQSLQSKLDEAKKRQESMTKDRDSVLAELLSQLNQFEVDDSSSPAAAAVAGNESAMEWVKAEAVPHQMTPASEFPGDEHAKKLQTELERLQQELSSATDENGELRRTIQQLEVQLCDGLGELQKCKEDLNDTRSNLTKQVEKLEKERAQLIEEQSLSRKSKENNEAALNMAREDAKAKAEKLASGERETQELRGQLEELRCRCATAEESLDVEKRKVQEAGDKERQLQAAIRDLTGRLEKQASEHDDRLVQAKRREEQLHKKMSEQAAGGRAAENAKQQAKAALDEARVQVARYQQQVKELGAAEKSARQQAQDATQKRDETMRMAEQLRGHFEAEQRRSSKAASELEALRLENAQVRTAYSEMDDRLRQLMAKEHDLKTHNDELQAELTAGKKLLQQSEDTMQLYQTTIADYQRDFTKEREEKEQLRQECAKLRDSLNKKIEEAAQQNQLLCYAQQQQQQPPRQQPQPQQQQQQQQRQQQRQQQQQLQQQQHEPAYDNFFDKYRQ